MAIFKPYKITSSQLEGLAKSEGQFIVTTDTNKIYLDETDSSRIELIPVPTKTSDLVNDMNFMSGMTILSYGHSTWSDFITAYTAKHVVYTRASSGSNPASGSQTRLAFMAYVNNADNPTEVEFQYYRSVGSHNNNQQGDQTYVYKLNKTNGWSVTVRENYTKVVGSDGITGTWSNGTLTLKHDASGVTAGTYKSVTVDAKGHVTAGSNPTTLSGYGITDAIDCDDNLPVASANYVGRVYCYTGSGNGISSDYVCGHIYQCLDLTAEGDYSWVDLTEKGYEYIFDLRNLINLDTASFNTDIAIQDTSLLNILMLLRNKTGTSQDETIKPSKLGLLVYTDSNSSQTDYHDHMFLNLQSITYASNGGDGWSESHYAYIFEGFSYVTLNNYVVALNVDTDYTYATYEVSIKNIQFQYMPIASSQYRYMTIQYVGSNSSDYLFGHFYRCQLVNNTYTWVPVNIEDTYTVFDAGSNTFNFFTAKPGTYICYNTTAQPYFRYLLTSNASSYTTWDGVPVKITILRSAADTTRLSGTYINSAWTTQQLMGLFEWYDDQDRDYLYTYGIFINKNQQIYFNTLQQNPNRVSIITDRTITDMFEPLELWIDSSSPITSLNYDYTMGNNDVERLQNYWRRGSWNTRAIHIDLGYNNILSFDSDITFYPIQEYYFGDDNEIYQLVSPTLNLGKAIGNIIIVPTFNASEEITGGTIKFRFIPNNTSDISHMDNVLVNKKYVDEHGSQRYDYELYSGITFNDLSKLGYWYTLSSDTALVSQLNQMIETGLFDDSYIKKITAVLTTCDDGCGYYKEMYTLQSIYADTSNSPELYYFVFSNFSNLQVTFRCSRDTTNTWAYQVTGSIEKCYTMSTPTFMDENKIVMYTGTTNSNYTNGYIYKCIRESYNTYVWQRIDVQPASTDTKNTAGTTNTISKIYLAGATSQADNPQTYSNVNCYASGGKLYSNAKEVVTLSDSQALTNKTYNGYTLAAASAKAVDTSISAGSTSTNLPTSQAVAAYVDSKQNQILSGTTDPSNSLGVNGDVYIKY